MTENKRYAVAIDIGTTTVALYLLDTKIKKTVSSTKQPCQTGL